MEQGRREQTNRQNENQAKKQKNKRRKIRKWMQGLPRPAAYARRYFPPHAPGYLPQRHTEVPDSRAVMPGYKPPLWCLRATSPEAQNSLLASQVLLPPTYFFVMAPAQFLLSKMGVLPITAPSGTLQTSGELHRRLFVPSWNNCLWLYSNRKWSSRVHLLPASVGYQQSHQLVLAGSFQEDPACSHSIPSHYWKYFKTLPREVRPQPWTSSKEEIEGSSPLWFS